MLKEKLTFIYFNNYSEFRMNFVVSLTGGGGIIVCYVQKRGRKFLIQYLKHT